MVLALNAACVDREVVCIRSQLLVYIWLEHIYRTSLREVKCYLPFHLYCFSLVFRQCQAREWRTRVLGRDLMFLWRPSSETCRQLAICLGSWCGVGDPFVHWVQESVGVVSLGRGRGNGWPLPLWPQLDFLRLKHEWSTKGLWFCYKSICMKN